jgi:3-vinyl bacteriochlorophyllide hydratase
MFTADVLSHVVNAFDSSPWGTSSGRCAHPARPRSARTVRPLYTPEERVRRDASPWTIVQGVLAPVQFLVFLISFGLVLNYLATGDGLALATFSIIVKTLVLYTIMVTGSIWEREVFGRYLFAPAFYWEDMVSMLVLALHTAYLAALLTGALSPHDLMLLALSAYVTYVVNAAQFVLKLRAARLAAARVATGEWPQHGSAAMGASR